jgi:hypothetical protein
MVKFLRPVAISNLLRARRWSRTPVEDEQKIAPTVSAGWITVQESVASFSTAER